MHETYCTPSAPSRRGVLAGTGFAGIATAQLFAAQAGAAGTSATLDRLKRAERDAAHQDNYIAVFMPPIRADGPKQEVRPGVPEIFWVDGAQSRIFTPPAHALVRIHAVTSDSFESVARGPLWLTNLHD